MFELNPEIDEYRAESPAETPFLIISGTGAGSSCLASMLGSHPDIVCFTELFYHRKVALPASHILTNPDELFAWRRGHPLEFLEQVFGQPYAYNIRAVGFKLLYQQAHDPAQHGLWDWLRQHREIRIIHTLRDNMLAQYLSIRQALSRRQYTAHRPPREGPLRLALPEDECEGVFERTTALIEHTRRFFEGHAFMEVEYQDLLENSDAVTRRLMDFLGVDRYSLVLDRAHMNPYPAPECIKNYAVLEKKFRGTRWARFFSD